MLKPLPHPTPLEGLMTVQAGHVGDARGRFMRLWCEDSFRAVAPGQHVVQVNQSFTSQRGTVRGMHFQRQPALEGKLVRCLRGEVFDVAVDVRRNSPTFGRWHGVYLCAGEALQLWLPPGFAHGFQTLTPEVEMLYLHTGKYSPTHEAGLRFDDPRLKIRWPLPVAQVSERDARHPLWSDHFEGVSA
jgi:dTDP-4-dehydrorhamnose 3,5-epimerase